MRPKSYTDAELRHLQFWLSDPNQQDGLVRAIPAGAELMRIINVYSSDTWPDQKVWCAYCQAHRHKRGFTAELTDSSLILLGSTCGAELFGGETWKVAHERLKEQETRQSYLFDADELRIRLPMIRECLADWRSVMTKFEGSHLRFHRSFRQLYEKLVYAVRYGDGFLEVYRKIKNPDPNATMKWTYATERVRFRGAAYFSKVGGTATLNQLGDWLDQFEEATHNTRTVDPREMKKLSKVRQDIVRDLETMREACAQGLNFFKENNLRLIAGWATKEESVMGNYRASKGVLVRIENDVEMDLDPDYRAPNLRLLELLNISSRQVVNKLKVKGNKAA